MTHMPAKRYSQPAPRLAYMPACVYIHTDAHAHMLMHIHSVYMHMPIYT